jgi:alkylhydroperoxidase family enzyme
MTAPDGFAAYLRRLGLSSGPDGERFTDEDAAGIMRALSAARHPASAAPRPAPAGFTDLSSPLHQAAISLHEAFSALTAAGFTEDQALKYLTWTRPPAAE